MSDSESVREEDFELERLVGDKMIPVREGGDVNLKFRES